MRLAGCRSAWRKYIFRQLFHLALVQKVNAWASVQLTGWRAYAFAKTACGLKNPVVAVLLIIVRDDL